MTTTQLALTVKQSKLCKQWIAILVLLPVVLVSSGCNPKAIPSVIFPAKPKLPVLAPAPPAVPVAAPTVEDEPVAIDITVNFFARDIVNPDINGSPSPVQTRVFLADNPVLFSKATFEQVFEFGVEKFQIQPLAIKTLRPGSVSSMVLSVEPHHKVLAVAAAYRSIGKTKWLETVSLENLKSRNINFSFSDFIVAHEKTDE